MCSAFCAPAPEPAPESQFDPEVEKKAILSVVDQIGVALNDHDTDAFVQLLVEDVEFWGGVPSGRTDYRDWWKNYFEQQTDFKWRVTEEIGMIFVTPEVAIYKFYGERSGQVDEDGNPIPPNISLCANVFVKRDGKWLEVAFFDRPVGE
jgi:uncharacterized protein (TIGR02246 family)